VNSLGLSWTPRSTSRPWITPCARLKCSTNWGIRLPRDVLEARIKLAERIGDAGELADSFTGLSVHYGQSGASSLAGVLLEAAADLARTNHQPAALARSLLNLTVHRMLDDLDKAIEVGHEAVSVASGAGVSVWISYSEINLLLALWGRGSWAEVEEILGNQSHRDELNVLISAVLVGSISSARGLPWSLPWISGEAPVGDDGSDIAWLSFAEVMQARERGDLESAVRLALDATEQMYALSGTWDDCTHMWPTAVEMALEACDDNALTRLLDLIDDGSSGPVSLAMRIHRKRVAGLLAIRDGESPEIVETTMHEVIAEFEEWGAMPYRARTQADLGAWLVAQGRAEEATPLLNSARAAFAELGATAWLEQLETQRTTVN